MQFDSSKIVSNSFSLHSATIDMLFNDESLNDKAQDLCSYIKYKAQYA